MADITFPLGSSPPASILDDRRLITRGLERCSPPRFAAWLTPWFVLLGIGVYAVYLCLRYGLNQTNDEQGGKI